MPYLAPEIHYCTAADGYRFAVRRWPTSNPPARAVVIHGIVSHGGWYLSTCRHLARLGVEVHAPDRRGSGLNMAARGDARHWATWLDDVELYVNALDQQIPTVLIGISWGGKLVAALARRNRLPLAGIVLIGPGLYAQQQPGPLKRSLLRAAVAAGAGRRRVTIPLADPALFTDTPRWKDYIRDDPFTLRRVTMRFALADLALNAYARAAAEHLTSPTLLMLAGRDRIVDNGRTHRFFERIAAPDKTCIEYPDAGHTLEFEPDPSLYLNDLASWIQGRSRKAEGAGDGSEEGVEEGN